MTVPGNLSSPLLATAAEAAAAAAGPIKSLRFNSADSAYLSGSGFANSDTKTMTFSFWLKRSASTTVKATQYVFSGGDNGTIFFDNDNSDQLTFNLRGTSGTNFFTHTEAILRDFSAWYHIVVALDLDNSTTSERFKCYINGVQQTMSNTSFPNNNFHDGGTWYIGSYTGTQHYPDYYLADFYHIAGLALDPTSFGAYDDNGVWQAAAYSGTFGTNGFHLLDFANESTVGHDSSGNENDFTANNLTAAAVNYTGMITSHAGQPSNLFDGNSGSAAYYNQTNELRVQFTNAISGTNLRLYVNTGSGSPIRVSTNGGTDFTSYTLYNGDQETGDYTITGGSLTDLRIQTNAGGGGNVYYVKVDGTILTDIGGEEVDVLFDVPTNGTQSDTGAGGEVSGNYCTWNPFALQPSGHGGLRQGNLEIIADTAGSHKGTLATFAIPSTGKWYWEVKAYRTGAINNGGGAVGVAEASAIVATAQAGTRLGNTNSSSWTLGLNDFDARHAGTVDYSDYLNGGSAVTDTGIIGIAVDMDNDKMWMHYNGTYGNAGGTGNPATGANPMFSGEFSGLTLFPAAGISVDSGSGYITANFGQRAFAYSAPSGFKALCTTNLPTPTIADGSEYFNTVLYSGNATARSITTGHSSDFVWIKMRNSGNNHFLFDIVRGVGRRLMTSGNNDEDGDSSTDTLTSFNSDGFSLGADTATGGVNANSVNLVAWSWDAGSSTVSNTDGSITSSVRASQTSGFSVVSYSGTGTAPSTVGHGLGTAPSLIFIKRRDTTGNWITYNSSIGAGKYLVLNNSGAVVTDSGPFNNTAATSTVFTVNTFSDLNANGGTYVAYCFAPVSGFSAFGSYTSSKPFVHLGFRPAFLIIKSTSTGRNWIVLDSARDPYNRTDRALLANDSAVEDNNSTYSVDFLSNGFKVQGSNGQITGDSKYIYLAFAENPFQANGGLAR